MKVLVACECFGKVRNAFLRLGADAYPCDIDQDYSTDPIGKGRHLQQDVTTLLQEKWDLVIAHPPCTYLANSGVQHLYGSYRRWEQLKEGAEFFLKCFNANAPFICVENPIPHKYAKEIIKTPYTQIVQPWMFGHNESKQTCLWLRKLPKLRPTNIVERNIKQSIYWTSGKYRQKLRSITFDGIAEAMATQWYEFFHE